MDSITLNIKGLTEFQTKLKGLEKKIAEDVDDVLNVNSEDIALEAKQRAPADEGNLRQSISADNSKFLEKHIAVNAVYAGYIEFGTGKYAAEYVSSLPESWQAFAAQFRGPTGQPFSGLLLAIQEWVRRKGIATGKDYKQVAYRIARKILINGVRPQPFLFPAFRQQEDIIIKNIEDVLNGL